MTNKVVYIQGAWDLLHIGHFNILYRASKIASRLIVGVDSDESIEKNKGHSPILSLSDRIKTLASCNFVDEIIKSESMVIDVDLLIKHWVDILALDSDKICLELPGRKEAQEAGIEVIYFPYTQSISSTMIRNILQRDKQ
jgi:glycerol-3-phosphate cytidylyltransferase